MRNSSETTYKTVGFKQSVKRTIIMHSKSQHKSQMPTEEVEYAIRDLSNTEYKLLTYYYSKNTGWTFHDDRIAELLSITLRRMREVRNSLVSKGYLLIVAGPVPLYFIGRKAVSDWQDAGAEQTDESVHVENTLTNQASR